MQQNQKLGTQPTRQMRGAGFGFHPILEKYFEMAGAGAVPAA
jgi:hypothetical protein